MKKEGEGRRYSREKGQSWSVEAIGMAQAVPTPPCAPHPPTPGPSSLVVVAREGERGCVCVCEWGGGDLGQSSLPKPLPTWVLKGAAVF